MPTMASPASVLTAKILARHGARPDLRLWRNETGLFWAGEVAGRTRGGGLLLRHASRVMAGLCKGSADLIGITNTGRFIGLEVKAGKDVLKPHQRAWLELIAELGGIAEVVSSVEDVDRVLGEAPR